MRLSLLLASLLLAPSAAFALAGTARLHRTRAAAVTMAGWNDEYGGTSFQQKAGKELKTKRTSFDDELDAANAENNKFMIGVSVGGIALIALIAAVQFSSN